jgi:hypothetical protein
MKKMLWILVWLLVCVGSANALTGIEIGIRTGVLSGYNQPSLNIGTYDLNRLNMVGGQIYFSRLPMVDIIVAGEYCWRTQNYDIAGENLQLKLHNFAVTASVVYPFKQLPIVTPYVGAGVGSYSLSYDYFVPMSLSLSDNGVSIPGTSTYMGYHGVLGAKVNVPAFPVGMFLEGRLNRINTPGDDIKYNTFAGGVFLALP